MSTPPDLTPYQLETDLRTAAHVWAWLDAYEAPHFHRRDQLAAARHDLQNRLEREHRQACERAAQEHERKLAEAPPPPVPPSLDIWGFGKCRARLAWCVRHFRALADHPPTHTTRPPTHHLLGRPPHDDPHPHPPPRRDRND